jgi:tetratricopeptide (TPR) repeat protein
LAFDFGWRSVAAIEACETAFCPVEGRNVEDPILERAMNAIGESVDLIEAGQREESLHLLDVCLAEAEREKRGDLIVMLSRHAEVLAQGDPQRAAGYWEKRRRHVPDQSFQLYNYAQLFLSAGKAEEARRCAWEAYRLSSALTTEDDRCLQSAILRQWPDIGEAPPSNNP